MALNALGSGMPGFAAAGQEKLRQPIKRTLGNSGIPADPQARKADGDFMNHTQAIW